MATKNLAGKTRKATQAYATWTNPTTGWRYSLLKSWQGNNAAPYSRWFMDVIGYGHDLGDTYVSEMLTGLLISDDLVFDTTIWVDRKAFFTWVKGG
jgi:hypothetical protein